MNRRVGEGIIIGGIQRPALQDRDDAVDVVMAVEDERRDAVEARQLRDGLLPRHVGKCVFEVDFRPVAAEVDVAEVLGEVVSCHLTNVLALGEEADFVALNFLPALNLIRNTKLHLSTKTAFLPNAC